jgi:hypothetical protein
MPNWRGKTALLTVFLTPVIYSDATMALECGSGAEPVLKIEYEVEDRVICQDPSLVGLPSSSTRGVEKSVLYQTKTKRKRVSTGKCVAPVEFKGKRMVYKNLDLHRVKIVDGHRTYNVDVTKKNGSVRHTVRDNAYEIGAKAYTPAEFSKLEKMEVLPGYVCGIAPPLPGDPNNTKICVADIDGMRVFLYKEFRDFFSDHVNRYKATSIEWVCEKSSFFNPPEGVELVRH